MSECSAAGLPKEKGKRNNERGPQMPTGTDWMPRQAFGFSLLLLLRLTQERSLPNDMELHMCKEVYGIEQTNMQRQDEARRKGQR